MNNVLGVLLPIAD